MRVARTFSLCLATVLAGCASLPASKPAVSSTLTADRLIVETRIDAMLARMSVEQKVSQIIMPDISTISPADVRAYRFGTILNGGNSGPGGNERAAPAQWLALADSFWNASTAPTGDGSPVIPTLWATDAVHGHNNVIGATIFPHNIALGATRSPELVRRIGAATAAEITATGIDWTFAPTLAVVRDDRWGRTYESFSEDPALVTRLGAAAIEGLQGKVGTREFLDQRHVLATAKHFFGDGGTDGVDQGDTKGESAAIEAMHTAPYPAAIAADVQTVMASFSSINGSKMHGSKPYLTDLLKQKWGFNGLVVGDWNGHGQLPGCSSKDCPDSLIAGLDVYMVPEDWKALHANLVIQAKDDRVPMARLDDAVRRVLRVKISYGLFDKPRPSARVLAGNSGVLGSPEHRAIAREAVRKSLVLLKNDGVLPIRPGTRILVAGDAANDIARQSGGWTISWQGGGDLTNADFPGAQSIFAGIAEAAQQNGSAATLSVDGDFTQRPDVAVVVFGETPYAEFSGDIKTLAFADTRPLRIMQRLKAQGIPVVTVFLSGRPMWMNREINQSSAFVAAWLPGSEGGGIADLLMANAKGQPRFDFTGRLPFSWPKACEQYALNSGEAGYAPLFRFGFGLDYRQHQPGSVLDEGCAAAFAAGDQVIPLLSAGRPLATSRLSILDRGGPALAVLGPSFKTPLGNLSTAPVDRKAQEDARRFRFSGPAAISLAANWDAPQWAKAQSGALTIEYSVAQRPSGPVKLVLRCGPDCGGEADITQELAIAEGKGWRTMTIPFKSLLAKTNRSGPIELQLQAAQELDLTLSAMDIVTF